MGGRGVVSHDTCKASSYGTIDKVSVQPDTTAIGLNNRQRSSSVEAASVKGSVEQVSVQPTPRHQPQTIPRVNHSSLAMLCEQGVTRWRGSRGVVSHDTY